LWNKKIYLDDILTEPGSSLKCALFKSGRDPLMPHAANLRESPLSEKVRLAGFSQNEFSDLSELERLVFRFLRRTVKSRHPGIRRIPQRIWKESPYLGLKTFEYRHAPVFFGRTFAISRSLELLRLQRAVNHNILVIHGSSGCGKSSLVKAGILPLFCEYQLYEGISQWDYVVVEFTLKKASWQTQIRQVLLDKFDGLEDFSKDVFDQDDIRKWIEAVALYNDSAVSKSGLIFFFDQFEAFLSQENDSSQRARFDQFLSLLAQQKNIIVIATLRSDFVPLLDSLSSSYQMIKTNGLFQLSAPNEYELNEIIRYPAIAAGLSFEDDPQTGSSLELTICREAVNSPEGLPLLEFLLSELYSLAQNDGLITWDEYSRLGGIEGALTQRAEKTLTDLPADCRLSLSRVILKLMSQTRENKLIRNWMPLNEVTDHPLQRQLLDHFVNARLFTIARRQESAIVSVSHEALIRSWPRITELAALHSSFLVFRFALEDSIKQWEKAGSETKKSTFLVGPQLLEASSYLDSSPEFLTQREKSFLHESLLAFGEVEQILTQQRLRSAKRTTAISLFLAVVILVAGSVIYYLYQQQINSAEQVAGMKEQSLQLEDKLKKQQAELDKLNRKKELIDHELLQRSADQKISQLANKLSAEAQPFMTSLKLLNGIPVKLRSWAWRHLYLKAKPSNYEALVGHSREVVCVNASADQRYIVTASWDDTAIIWDAQNASVLARLDHRSSRKSGADVECALFSPDSKYVITSCSDGTVRVWDVQASLSATKANYSYKFKAANKAVRDMKFCGNYLITCDDRGALKSWHWSIKSFAKPIHTAWHKKNVRCTSLSISPNGNLLASSGWTESPRLWKVDSMGFLKRLLSFKPVSSHKDVIRDIDFISNDKLLSVSKDKSLIVWEVSSGKQLWKDASYKDDLTSVLYIPATNEVVTGSKNRFITTKKLYNKTVIRKLKIHSDTLQDFCLLPGRSEFVSASSDTSASVYSIKNNNSSKRLPYMKDFAFDKFKGMCFSEDSKSIFILNEDLSILQLDPQTGKQKLVSSAGQNIKDKQLIHFSYIEDKKNFIAVMEDGSNYVIDELSSTIKAASFFQSDSILSLKAAKISPDKSHLILLDSDGKLVLVNSSLNDISQRSELLSDQYFSQCCWLSSNTLLLVDKANNIYEYSLPLSTLRELLHSGHGRLIYQISAQLNEAGPVCLTTSRDNTVVLTKLSSFIRRKFDHNPRSDVFLASLANDGKTLLSICQRDNTPYLWNADSQQELFSLTPLPSPVLLASFSPDSSYVVCVSRDGLVRVYFSK
ncbi:MAG: hypothetical protein HRT88_07085, partial [Lentisphaeraceae bacterium]|nr:hypothetical protein [Lentisphaeraceae bacterium]